MSAPEPGLVAIVTAIPEEFEAIEGHISDRQRLRAGDGDGGFLLRGRIAGAPVLLVASGDGAARASASVSFLLRESPVSFLVGAGAAGALDPSLRTGEIVVADRILDEKGDGPRPDETLVARARSLGAIPATFVQAARPICSSKEKEILAVRLRLAGGAPAVVDMESSEWARAAALHGVPFLLLRAVSDTFEEDLPGFLSDCLSAEGSVNRAAVARKLITHPTALPVLLRARKRVREAACQLGAFLERFLTGSAPPPGLM